MSIKRLLRTRFLRMPSSQEDKKGNENGMFMGHSLNAELRSGGSEGLPDL